MNNKIFGALLAAAMTVTAVTANAQSVSISRDGRPERLFRPVSGLSSMDINFLKNASLANIFEIKAGELAQERGASDFVRQYGKEMVHEHTLAQEELKALAMDKGVSLPQDLPAPMSDAIRKLSTLNGAAFDAEFQKWQKAGHEMTSVKFKKEIRSGRDQDVKGYAVKTLPAVSMHYRMLLAKKTMMGPTKMEHGI